VFNDAGGLVLVSSSMKNCSCVEHVIQVASFLQHCNS